MDEYRSAAESAITAVQHLPIGMEWFVSSPDTSLEMCLREVRGSDMFVAVVGMRYGSVDEPTGKSYSQLEYEEAVTAGIPVLPFVLDGSKVKVLPDDMDTGVAAERLAQFKKMLDANHTVQRFTSADNLRDLVSRSVTAQVVKLVAAEEERRNTPASPIQHIAGAELFKEFLLRPQVYKGRNAVLRVRMIGGFGTWRVKEEVFSAFECNAGKDLFLKGCEVLGVDMSDVESEGGTQIDVITPGSCGDWLRDQKATRGTVFESRFEFRYEEVRGVGEAGQSVLEAALVMVEPGQIIVTVRLPASRETGAL